MSRLPRHIDFGWVLPTGKARMPSGKGGTYLNHIQHVLERIDGSFQSLWMPDHFMDDQADILEALTTLSFLAGMYPEFDLGTIVLGQNYRNPALLAKTAATLQELSDGRFILGIGAGWKMDEYQAYGYDFPPASTRIAQMAEVVQICRMMWDPSQPNATFHGEHYRINAAVCNPKPSPPPPILIGGGGEKLMLRKVAEHADWWNLPGIPSAEYACKLDVLARHCATVGRDPATIRKTWMGVVSIAPTRSQAEAQLAGYPIWPGDTPLAGTPDDVQAQLQAYVDLGVDYFMLAFADEPALEGISLFITEIAQAWRKR